MPENTQIATLVARGFELTGIIILVAGAAAAFGAYLAGLVHRQDPQAAYRGLREALGKAILVGLEVLVAADIIRSVAIAPTLLGVVVLGLIVLVRTFLSWSLEVEISGHWPWQRGAEEPLHGRDVER